MKIDLHIHEKRAVKETYRLSITSEQRQHN